MLNYIYRPVYSTKIKNNSSWRGRNVSEAVACHAPTVVAMTINILPARNEGKALLLFTAK